MRDNLKKILIVCSYSPPSIGGPQVLYNLLKNFPPESYTVLTSYYNIDDVSALQGTWLYGTYIFYDNPHKGKEARISEAKSGKHITSNRIQKLKLAMKRIRWIRTLAGFPVILSQIFAIVRTYKIAVKNPRTDIILGISDYGPAILGSYILHKITGKPLYLFMFDLYKNNFFPFPGGIIASLFEKRIFNAASRIFVTNDGTKNYYEKEYGRAFGEKISVIYNSTFRDKVAGSPVASAALTSKSCNILFTGRVNWPQVGAIKNLILAVEDITDINAIFSLYSPMPKEYLNSLGIFESEKVKFSFAPPEEIMNIQNKADILFLPLSWNTKSQAIIDTATPGKMTDYLLAGKPILVHAPASSFLVKYAKENGFAAVVDEENIEKLKTAIRRLINEKEWREELVKNAERTFSSRHDADTNSKIFANLFK
jgi:glycosyltransferase involved in cell wall biosynthesis